MNPVTAMFDVKMRFRERVAPSPRALFGFSFPHLTFVHNGRGAEAGMDTGLPTFTKFSGNFLLATSFPDSLSRPKFSRLLMFPIHMSMIKENQATNKESFVLINVRSNKMRKQY